MNESKEQSFLEEFERIKVLLDENGVKPKKIQVLIPVIENTAWMKVKLDETREAVKTSKIVIAYDNGGGQKGLRENPIFKGYENLWKSYMQGMKQIIDAIPQQYEEIKSIELERPKTMLDVVRQRKQQS